MDENGDSIVISSFTKNNYEAVCVGVSEWKGEKKLYIRIFTQVIGEDTLVPTKKGISLPIEKTQELAESVRKLGDVMSSEKVVGKITKNSKQQVWVGFNTYRKMPLIYVRTYTDFGEDDPDYKPTKAGISMRVDLYPCLLEAVEKLEEYVKANIDN